MTTMQSSTLSRTSSAASISSDDSTYLKQVLGLEPRRTRKRFTSAQLVMLEQLFHQSSHPTREEREAVAHAAGMEMKSVTIWFQNKRQTERKALHHASTQPAAPPSSSPSALSAPHASTSTSASTSASTPTPAVVASASTLHPIRTHTRTLSAHTPRHKLTPPRTRPSLDRVATRSESRLPPPRTPTRPRNPHASPWDNMPSSPLAPPASPPVHEHDYDLIAFMGGSRTLEWACAAARLAGKDKERQRPCARERDREMDGDGDRDGEGELTEEDDVEAVTPEGSLGASDAARWHGHGTHARPRLTSMAAPAAEGEHEKWSNSYGDRPSEEVPQDEDTMHAALALCGLGRRNA